VSVPNDIVQVGMINPAQLQTWLSVNFDFPFIVSGADSLIESRDESHGSATQIYTLAASQAQPSGKPGTDTWKRVAGQIAAAQQSLGPPNTMKLVVCEPDDWPMPASNYWTKFDFSERQTQTTTASPVSSLPIVKSELFMVRSLQNPTTPIGAQMLTPQVGSAARLAIAPLTPRTQAEVVQPHLELWRSSVGVGRLPPRLNTAALLGAAPPVKIATISTSSTIAVHLEHQAVSLGRFLAGQPWWDGAFLADGRWYVQGTKRGALLPETGRAGTVYALPTAMTVVRNLSVSGQWSKEAAATLSSPGGTLGPLSLFGAAAAAAADGVTITFSHTGMQVVALLCTTLPVVPPIDAPDEQSLLPDSQGP
jgi:hypothetical protein